MTLRSSFSDLFKENLKQRLWSPALTSLLFFFLFPVRAGLDAANTLDLSGFTDAENFAEIEAAAKLRLFKSFVTYSNGDNIGLTFLFLLIAAAITCSGFSYLYDRRKTDFYHSLPIRRETLFLAVHAVSLLEILVPYLVMTVVSALITQNACGRDCITPALSGFFTQSAFCFLFCGTAVLAVMMTGHAVVALLFFGLLLFWGPMIVVLMIGLKSRWFSTYWENAETSSFLMRISSPFTWCMDTDGFPAGQRAVIAFAAGIIFLVIALLLYRIRRSEAAGHAMAFPASEAPVRWLIAVPAALCGTFAADFFLRSDAFTVFGLLMSLLICHCVTEIIYHFDFKKLFSHKRQLLFSALLSLLIFCFFRFDLSGFDRYLPDETAVLSAGFCSDALEENLNQYQDRLGIREYDDFSGIYVTTESSENAAGLSRRMQVRDVSAVRAIAEAGIRNGKAEDNFDGTEDRILCFISWHLKNGRTMTREYRLDPAVVQNAVDAVMNGKEYKEAVFPLLTRSADSVTGIFCQDPAGSRRISAGDPAFNSALFTAYTEDLRNLTMETRRNESVIGCLQFRTAETDRIAETAKEDDPRGERLLFSGFYPVYPSFRNTLSVLKDAGISLNEALAPENIKSIELRDWNVSYNTGDDTAVGDADGAQPLSPLVVTDPEEIRELLDCMICSSLSCSNGMNQSLDRIRVKVNFVVPPEDKETGDPVDTRFELDADRVPAFVKEYFRL